MCGFVGYWSSEDGDAWRSNLQTALCRIKHRGPDDTGIWFNGAGLGLGHVRLSILDLSTAGHQPMASADGRRVLVYNGEVYNFRAIRRELEGLGQRFSGSGDTEVVLAALETWGVLALERFVGMFALAYWDEDRRKLLLVRDRLGVKPLYYGLRSGAFVFGSELKALRALDQGSHTLDRAAIGDYFRYLYIAGTRSIYQGISKLLPGHYVEVGEDGPGPQRPYWTLEDSASAAPFKTEAEAEDCLEALLRDAFRLRMVSDVPVGIFLSGGVDSSLVAAVLQMGQSEPIHTYTIGFQNAAFDESRWAAKVAAHVGTIHHERVLRTEDALSVIPRWADLFDEPFGDSSGIPTFMVARAASEEVKVVLSADGGDELFGGYTHYAEILQRRSAMRRVPSGLRNVAAGIVGPAGVALAAMGALGSPWTRTLESQAEKLGRVLPDVELSALHDVAMCYWQPEEVRRLLGEEGRTRKGLEDWRGTDLQRMCLWDFHHYLPEDILTKVDRATMANSIEGREPLLDHRLAEFAFRLPDHLRHGPLGTKHLLRKILYRYVPRALIDRPKQGFAVPLTDWLRGPLSPLLGQYLDPVRIRNAGILDPVVVERTLRQFRAGAEDNRDQLWSLLAFEMWREKWA